MKRSIPFAAAVLMSTIAFGPATSGAQNTPATGSTPGGTASPGAPAAAPTPPPGTTTPRQIEPTIPGKPAPVNPKMAQPLPGQQGTIPEQIQPPGTAPQTTTGGLSADQIRRAQEALKAKGMNPGTISGSNDPSTQQAIRDFQKANNLPVTGVLDQNTLDKLGVSGTGAPAAPSTQNSDTAPQGNRVVP